MFFSLAQPGVIMPTTAPYRIFMVLTILLLIVFLLNKGGRGTEYVSLKQNKFIYGMVIIYTLSEAQYFWITGTLDAFEFWFKKAILFFVIINIIRTSVDLKKIVWAIVFAAGYLTYLGWDLYIHHPEMMDNAGRFQSVGNYNLSNSYALLATLVWPLAFFLLEAEKSMLKKLILFIALIGLLVSCLYTKSRGGILGISVAVTLSIFFSKTTFNTRMRKMSAVGALLGVVFVYGFGLILTRDDVESVTGGDASAGDRLMAWEAAIGMFLSQPLLGVGWNHFMEESLNYGMDKRLLAHNTILSVLAETGIFGITFFIGMLYYSIKQLWDITSYYRRQGKVTMLSCLTNGVLLSLLCFLVNTSFSVKDHDPMFWADLTLAGAVVAVYKNEVGEIGRNERIRAM